LIVILYDMKWVNIFILVQEHYFKSKKLFGKAITEQGKVKHVLAQIGSSVKLIFDIIWVRSKERSVDALECAYVCLVSLDYTSNLHIAMPLKIHFKTVQFGHLFNAKPYSRDNAYFSLQILQPEFQYFSAR
jgi:hypothetical protein